MNKYLPFILFFIWQNAFAQITPYEKGNKLVTTTYTEAIAFYQKIDQQSTQVKMLTMGNTDANEPLHLVLVSSNGKFDATQWHKEHKTVLLINNGIHPGEPDGIDACMLLVRNIATKKIVLPANVCLAIIPIYNIGGSLNRSKNYRVDQNGPEEFGFRGNSQNLDLNRDLIKCDSREARSFAEIFHLLDPDIFIDNHVSNGADYQHVMTLIATQHNKLGGGMDTYLNTTFKNGIYNNMAQYGYNLVPYVNFFGETPEQGWTEFFDSPRYSTGYTTLWHTFGFVPETHMLKPYYQRVDATYKLMQSFINFSTTNGLQLQQIRASAKAEDLTKKTFTIDWVLDKTVVDSITFMGYESGKKPSLLTGQDRLYYDRTKPFTKKIPFYNNYVTNIEVAKPLAYIIPQGWWKVIELLKINKVKMYQFKKDDLLNVGYYNILEYKANATPYENHHSNGTIKVTKSTKMVQFRKGDYYIPLNQNANRFLIETLEPQAKDSYFAWNFFDGILGQKEGYSDYVFEETALQILKENEGLKNDFEAKKQTDQKFAKDGAAQLDYIYKNSKYFEPAYMHYPVYSVY